MPEPLPDSPPATAHSGGYLLCVPSKDNYIALGGLTRPGTLVSAIVDCLRRHIGYESSNYAPLL